MTRALGRPLAAILLFVAAGTLSFAADPPATIETKALDKAIIASLREVHDRGADLYNLTKDYPAAFRLYEGSLLTVKPLLAHRPDVQKAIDEGFASAGKEGDPARKAFLLHEAIEKVRGDLKGPAIAPKPPKPPVETKPKDPATLAPMPKVKDPKAPAAKDGTISGVVTFQGQPVPEGAIGFVSLDPAKPAKFATAIEKDGTFGVKGVPPGEYAVTVAPLKDGKALVPAKFAAAETSGLRFAVTAGKNQFDVDLK